MIPAGSEATPRAQAIAAASHAAMAEVMRRTKGAPCTKSSQQVLAPSSCTKLFGPGWDLTIRPWAWPWVAQAEAHGANPQWAHAAPADVPTAAVIDLCVQQVIYTIDLLWQPSHLSSVYTQSPLQRLL